MLLGVNDPGAPIKMVGFRDQACGAGQIAELSRVLRGQAHTEIGA